MDASEPRSPTPDEPARSAGGEDVPRPEERDAEEATAVLKWPPPGLSRMQGDLWTVVKQAGTGGALLVFPLLWSLASEQELWSLGPLGGSWWVVLLTSFAGLALLVNAFVGLFRLCRRAASATDRGYGWITLALVASDARRDAGFLLQGARAYSVLDPEERRRLIVQRLVAVAAYLGAVLWLPAGFAAGLLFAGRGILSPSSFALFTLAPAALLATVALLVRIVESRTVRRAKRAWFDQPWSRDLAQGEVASWNLAYAERREAPLPGPGAIGEGRRFRIGAALVLGLAVLVFLPALTLLFATAMGPVVGGVSAPEYSGTQRKAASVEAFRPYVLAADS
ncbi:MAG: hypothetical protein GWM92_21285, partial [Gemmatimonadetes bacterium]|nr:hypothetical protein [Gemmatimonadota bacterium]NIR79407.1 hypothetical protein [Gemmatimonadota bacterium]NIT90227.1 hypothetical protein [Gemmatimonadota bacterium]NIU34055.1 hypothetical protein [Gemmatimonadota bacterium]NIU36527.1 hypothetical protein [Gemmatimonadota bacterium]